MEGSGCFTQVSDAWTQQQNRAGAATSLSPSQQGWRDSSDTRCSEAEESMELEQASTRAPQWP